MRLILTLCVPLLLCPSAAFAKDYDYKAVLAEVSGRSAASAQDKALWRSQLDKAAGVSAEDTRAMFRDAAREFGVPQVLLEAIGYLENNWIQIGPSVDSGWGVMHLVDNDYCRTLDEAAELLGVEPRVLKDDPRQNIRGAAALLAAYAGKAPPMPAPSHRKGSPGETPRALEDMPGVSGDALQGAPEGPEPKAGRAEARPYGREARLEDWFDAASRFSGLRTRKLRDMQARNYFGVIAKGVTEKNVFNQIVEIEPVPVDLDAIGPAYSVSAAAVSSEYPEALSDMSQYNFSAGRRGQPVDTVVEHWMGVGTYAGAISWFHNPNAEASAHFCIRHDDGEVTQVISVDDTAWHSGCRTCPWTNNARSIGVEHEATITHPEWWNSEPMLDASARLTRFFCDKYGIPLKHPEGLDAAGGIIGHKQVPGCTVPDSGCHSECPGPLPWEVLMGKILAIP